MLLGLYGIVLIGISVRRLLAGIPGLFDLGWMVAGLRAVSDHGPLAPIPWSGISLLENHFSPALLPLSHVGRLDEAGVVLVAIQVLSVVGGVALLWFAFRSMSVPPRADRLLITAGLALHPALLYAAFFDVHSNVIAVLPVAAMCWGLICRNGPLVAVSALAAALLREDVALLVILLLAAHFGLVRSMRIVWVPLIVAVLAGLWGLTLRDEIALVGLLGASSSRNLFQFAGDSLSNFWDRGLAISTLVTLSFPWILVRRVDHRFWIPVAAAFLPLLFLANAVTRTPSFHYFALAPLVLAFGCAKSLVHGSVEDRTPRVVAWIAVGVLTLSGPLGLDLYGRSGFRNSLQDVVDVPVSEFEQFAELRHALGCLEPNDSASVDPRLVPWSGGSPAVLPLPLPFEDLRFDIAGGSIVMMEAGLSVEPDAVISTKPPARVASSYHRDPDLFDLWWRDPARSCDNRLLEE